MKKVGCLAKKLVQKTNWANYSIEERLNGLRLM